MKKVIFGLFAIALVSGTVISCKKEKTKQLDCKTATANFEKASSAYSGNPSPENCKSLKAALQDMLNSECSSSMSSEQKAEYQEALSGLNCN